MKNHRIIGERVFQAVLMGIMGGFAALSVFAGEIPESPPNPPRLVDYVAPSLLETNAQRHTLAKGSARFMPLTQPSTAQVVNHDSVLTAGERWMNFESEYGITEKEPTSVGRFIQSAKYQLDSVTFDAVETAHRLEFSHRLGDLWSSEPYEVPDELRYLFPLLNILANGQIKSVITLHDPDTGKVFAGLQYVLAFGPK